MNEDEAFIRAIREAPDDETARLVYTDWLDDRDDPRGAYLRAETEWVALQPTDEQSRTCFRQLSQHAATLVRHRQSDGADHSTSVAASCCWIRTRIASP